MQRPSVADPICHCSQVQPRAPSADDPTMQRAAARQAESSRLCSPALGSEASKVGAHNDMNDSTDNIIVDTATRIFQDLCEPATVNEAEEGKWPKGLWDALEESGLTLAWVPDDLGGAGATMADGFTL